MNVHIKIQKMRRATLEAYIEQMIALLDAMDGDPDLEDGDDAESEETDENGDEGDFSGYTEDSWTPFDPYSLQYDGSGYVLADEMIRSRTAIVNSSPTHPSGLGRS